MCGTGRFLLALQKEGYEVHGFDASEAMLEKLHVKAKDKQIKPTVWYGFVQDLAQTQKYSLIFIPSGSFSLITERKDIQKSLKTIYDYLDDKGCFVFEVETQNSVPSELGIWRGSRWRMSDGKMILLSQLAILEEEVCYSVGKYELLEGNTVIQTEIEEYQIRIYQDRTLLIGLLYSVGFKEVRMVKAFDRSAIPNETDESIVFECRK